MSSKEWFVVGLFVGFLAGAILGLASCVPDAPAQLVSQQGVIKLAGPV